MIREAIQFGRRKATRALVNTANRINGRQTVDVIGEEWDVLIILDACRTDYYEQYTPFDGTPETRWSPGSASHEWMEATFVGRNLHDTVYVTPNPHISFLDDGIFHYIEDCRDAWNEELQTVRPETMTKIAGRTADEYPNKRLIVHYMQPHTPYLGPMAERIRETTPIAGWKTDHESDGVPEERDRPTVWDLALEGAIDWEDVRKAYAEMLEIAFEAVEESVGDLEGRVVITADHGELLGERVVPGGPREWAHPEQFAATALREVPWHAVQDGEREIVAEPPVGGNNLSEEEVNDRLAALGYVPEDTESASTSDGD